MPTDDSPSMDADDFNDQHVNSTHQPEQPCFTFNSDSSNCTSTQVPSDNSRRIGIDVSYELEQDDLNDFNNQHTNSTLQLEHPYPIIIAGNFINNKYGCCSGDCNATSYSDWGTVHVPMTMVLVSWGAGLEGDQLRGVIHRNNKLVSSMEHHQVRSNHVPDEIHHAYHHDIVSPLLTINHANTHAYDISITSIVTSIPSTHYQSRQYTCIWYKYHFNSHFHIQHSLSITPIYMHMI